jgi:cytochrome c
MAVLSAAMRAWLCRVVAPALLLLAACDSGNPDAGAPSAPGGSAITAVRAAGFDPGPVKSAAEYSLEPELAGADVARGELLALACAACHRFRAEQGTLIGPHLQGVFGRKAASIEGFDYSPALRGSGLVWTPRALDAWLVNPAGFVEGTTMPFTGYRSAEDRRDLIAYLLRATQ